MSYCTYRFPNDNKTSWFGVQKPPLGLKKRACSKLIKSKIILDVAIQNEFHHPVDTSRFNPKVRAE